MARIHYFVHGRGRGHATRTAAIVRCLQAAEHEVEVSAGPDAVALLEPVAPTRAVRSLPPRLGLATLGAAATRVAESRSTLRRGGVELVVSDGDLPGLLAARSLGLPAVAVGHGLVFSRCRRPVGAPSLPWWREALKAELSSLGAQAHVAVNFVPLAIHRRSTWLARPSVPPSGDRMGLARGDRVVCYFREGGRDVLDELVRLGERPIVFADADPDVPGVDVRARDRDSFVAALRQAKAVIGTAGSQLTSECVELGIPLFALHRRDDDEQRLNVVMLRAAGLGDGAAIEDVDAPRLRGFLRNLRTVPASTWTADRVPLVVLQACHRLLGVPCSA